MSPDIDKVPAQAVTRIAFFARFEAAGPVLYAFSSGASPTEPFPGLAIAAVPTLDFDLEPMAGDAATWKASLAMAKVEPFDSITRSIPTSVVQVELHEMIEGQFETSLRPLFKGTVERVIANPGGQASLVKLMLEGILARGNAALGISCTQKCQARLGDNICQKDLTGLTPTVTISAISGYSVTLTGLTPTDQAGYFKRGFLKINGAPVLIRDYTTGTTAKLSWRLPAELIGSEAVAVPGCDGRPETCEDRWDNTENFFGLGVAIPDRDPSFQS